MNHASIISGLALGAALVASPAPAPAAESGIAGAPAATAAVAADPQAPRSAQAPAPEVALAELARTALREPESVETWTSISRVLREFRPEAFRDIPSGAERAALEVVESVAARVPGALREVRVEPSGPHTEIVVHTNGEIRHRLFRRLSDTDDPRLILVLNGASIALTETEFDRIDRGGVRAIRVGEPAPDTVHVTIHLAQATGFMLLRREGQIVVRIDNPAGPFAPWSSRPSWAVPPAAAQRTEASVPTTAGVDRGDDRTSPAPIDAPDTVDPIGSVAIEGVHGVEEPAAAAAPLASTVQASRATIGAAGRTLRDLVGRFRAPAPARVAEVAVALAILGVALVGFVRHRHGVPGSAPAAKLLRRRRAAAGRSPAAARVWAARTLVASGAPTLEVARRTGLPQDALVLLRSARSGAAEAALPAASGSFFRPTTSHGAPRGW